MTPRERSAAVTGCAFLLKRSKTQSFGTGCALTWRMLRKLLLPFAAPFEGFTPGKRETTVKCAALGHDVPLGYTKPIEAARACQLMKRFVLASSRLGRRQSFKLFTFRNSVVAAVLLVTNALVQTAFSQDAGWT